MPPGESHVSRISKEYYVNYFNSSHRELGPPVKKFEYFCAVPRAELGNFKEATNSTDVMVI